MTSRGWDTDATVTAFRGFGRHGQRLAALERANEVRFARAYLKRDLAAGHIGAGDVLMMPHRLYRDMRVEVLLGAVRGCGPRRVKQMMVRARVEPGTTLRALTAGQRIALRSEPWLALEVEA